MERDLLGETKSKATKIYAKVDNIMLSWRYTANTLSHFFKHLEIIYSLHIIFLFVFQLVIYSLFLF